MKNQTVWLVAGAVVLYYLYTKSQAATQAAQLQQASSNQTSNYISEGLDVADDLF